CSAVPGPPVRFDFLARQACEVKASKAKNQRRHENTPAIYASNVVLCSPLKQSSRSRTLNQRSKVHSIMKNHGVTLLAVCLAFGINSASAQSLSEAALA